MKKYQIFLLIIALGLMFASCGAQKGAGKSGSKQKNIHSSASFVPTQAYDALVSSYKDWQTVEIPVKIEISSPMQFGCSARVQMIRGRWLGISIRMLGFEVAYLTADNDSVHAYAKVQKRYVSESIDRLFSSSGYNLENLQDLLLGRVFVPGGTTATPADASKFNLSELDGTLLIVPLVQPEMAQIGFASLPETGSLLTTTCMAGADKQVVLTYGAAKNSAGGAVASETAVTAATTSIGAEALIKWDVNGARWNRQMTPRQWKVPSGARRIKVTSELLKSLTGI